MGSTKTRTARRVLWLRVFLCWFTIIFLLAASAAAPRNEVKEAEIEAQVRQGANFWYARKKPSFFSAWVHFFDGNSDYSNGIAYMGTLFGIFYGADPSMAPADCAGKLHFQEIVSGNDIPCQNFLDKGAPAALFTRYTQEFAHTINAATWTCSPTEKFGMQGRKCVPDSAPGNLTIWAPTKDNGLLQVVYLDQALVVVVFPGATVVSTLLEYLVDHWQANVTWSSWVTARWYEQSSKSLGYQYSVQTKKAWDPKPVLESVIRWWDIPTDWLEIFFFLSWLVTATLLVAVSVYVKVNSKKAVGSVGLVLLTLLIILCGVANIAYLAGGKMTDHDKWFMAVRKNILQEGNPIIKGMSSNHIDALTDRLLACEKYVEYTRPMQFWQICVALLIGSLGLYSFFIVPSSSMFSLFRAAMKHVMVEMVHLVVFFIAFIALSSFVGNLLFGYDDAFKTFLESARQTFGIITGGSTPNLMVDTKIGASFYLAVQGCSTLIWLNLFIGLVGIGYQAASESGKQRAPFWQQFAATCRRWCGKVKGSASKTGVSKDSADEEPADTL